MRTREDIYILVALTLLVIGDLLVFTEGMRVAGLVVMHIAAIAYLVGIFSISRGE